MYIPILFVIVSHVNLIPILFGIVLHVHTHWGYTFRCPSCLFFIFLLLLFFFYCLFASHAHVHNLSGDVHPPVMICGVLVFFMLWFLLFQIWFGWILFWFLYCLRLKHFYGNPSSLHLLILTIDSAFILLHPVSQFSMSTMDKKKNYLRGHLLYKFEHNLVLKF